MTQEERIIALEQQMLRLARRIAKVEVITGHGAMTCICDFAKFEADKGVCKNCGRKRP